MHLFLNVLIFITKKSKFMVQFSNDKMRSTSWCMRSEHLSCAICRKRSLAGRVPCGAVRFIAYVKRMLTCGVKPKCHGCSFLA